MTLIIVIVFIIALYRYVNIFSDMVKFSETRKSALNTFFNNGKSNKSNLKRLRRKIK